MSDVPKPVTEKRMSILERLKKLDDERAKLLDGAKAEALEKANAAIKELNDLGFTYRLTEGMEDGRKGRGKGISRKRDPNKPCAICNFTTDPPHDGRSHKNKQKKPAAFTADELKQYGYKKVAAAKAE